MILNQIFIFKTVVQGQYALTKKGHIHVNVILVTKELLLIAQVCIRRTCKVLKTCSITFIIAKLLIVISSDKAISTLEDRFPWCFHIIAILKYSFLFSTKFEMN